MVQNPQFLINIRKNISANNPGYGKYYPKAYVRHVYHIIRSVSNTRITFFSIARSRYNHHFLDYHEMVFLYVCVVFKDF